MERSFQKAHDCTTVASSQGKGAVDSDTAKAEKKGTISANVAVVRTITRQTRSKKTKKWYSKRQWTHGGCEGWFGYGKRRFSGGGAEVYAARGVLVWTQRCASETW